MRAATRPCWNAVTAEALLSDASLARVFAAMGFTRHFFVASRGDLDCWPPAYAVIGPASPHRPVYAANNRARRDAPVHFVATADRLYMIDASSGEWRSAKGEHRGDDLITLGMLRWSCRYGQAGARIARCIGIRVPALPVEPGRHARAA